MARPEQPLPPVGITGLGVAAIRAAESARPDRLFDDPFAERFAEAGAFEGLRGDPAGRSGLAAWIAVRTRFLDDLVLEACGDGCRQVAILGAGLDARAFRLDWPAGTRLWEVDLPAVLRFKEHVVRSEGWQPACERTALAADLAGDWGGPLLAAGLDAGATVTWVAEGLLAYLTADEGDLIVGTAARLSVPGSKMGLTVASPERLRRWVEANADRPTRRGDYVALWRSGGKADPVGWLASLGWDARVYRAADRARAYGRELERADAATSETSGGGLVDAARC